MFTLINAQTGEIIRRCKSERSQKWWIARLRKLGIDAVLMPKGKTKTVRNLMSGKDVEIAYDTPRCCDPSSELYWSM